MCTSLDLVWSGSQARLPRGHDLHVEGKQTRVFPVEGEAVRTILLTLRLFQNPEALAAEGHRGTQGRKQGRGEGWLPRAVTPGLVVSPALGKSSRSETAVPSRNLPGICGESQDTSKVRGRASFQGVEAPLARTGLLMTVCRLVSCVPNYFFMLARAMQRKGELIALSANLTKRFGIDSVAP